MPGFRSHCTQRTGCKCRIDSHGPGSTNRDRKQRLEQHAPVCPLAFRKSSLSLIERHRVSPVPSDSFRRVWMNESYPGSREARSGKFPHRPRIDAYMPRRATRDTRRLASVRDQNLKGLRRQSRRAMLSGSARFISLVLKHCGRMLRERTKLTCPATTQQRLASHIFSKDSESGVLRPLLTRCHCALLTPGTDISSPSCPILLDR